MDFFSVKHTFRPLKRSPPLNIIDGILYGIAGTWEIKKTPPWPIYCGTSWGTSHPTLRACIQALKQRLHLLSDNWFALSHRLKKKKKKKKKKKRKRRGLRKRTGLDSREEHKTRKPRWLWGRGFGWWKGRWNGEEEEEEEEEEKERGRRRASGFISLLSKILIFFAPFYS